MAWDTRSRWAGAVAGRPHRAPDTLCGPAGAPAMRLARYARYSGRRSSPGADVEILSFRERIVLPVFQRVLDTHVSRDGDHVNRTIR